VPPRCAPLLPSCSCLHHQAVDVRFAFLAISTSRVVTAVDFLPPPPMPSLRLATYCRGLAGRGLVVCPASAAVLHAPCYTLSRPSLPHSVVRSLFPLQALELPPLAPRRIEKSQNLLRKLRCGSSKRCSPLQQCPVLGKAGVASERAGRRLLVETFQSRLGLRVVNPNQVRRLAAKAGDCMKGYKIGTEGYPSCEWHFAKSARHHPQLPR
jgi:hypothetical protein